MGGRNEIHLVGYAATDKINKSIVSRESGKLLSATDPFKTIKNEPFALALPVSFKYPTEGQKVYDAYPLFKDWVTSGGLQNANWYLNK
ncbi:hypothetical protein D3C87_1499170 [compost metagenome]